MNNADNLSGQKGRFSFLNPYRHLAEVFRSLKYRNYRLFFIGQSISLIGTWMQSTAMSWLVYRLTDSAAMLGIVAFAGQIPTFLVSQFGGVASDRYSRRNLLLLTQILSALQAFLLAWLVLSGKVQEWHLIALSIALGIINGFDMPNRQAFVVHMIEDRQDMSNAIALNSSMVHMARLIGPSLAGILISTVGEGICFTLNAVSYIVVIVMILMMVVTEHKNVSKDTVLQQLKGGLKYMFGFEPVRCLMAMLSLLSIAGMPYVVLMPVFARDILHGDSRTFGFLMGSSGFGALMGAAYLAKRKSVLGLGKVIAVASCIFGMALIGLSLSTAMWLSMLSLVFVGLGMILHFASSNTVLQTIVEDDMRGRIMSFYTMAFIGMVPLGNLAAGYMAAKIGAPKTLMIGGAICIISSIWFLRRLPAIRQQVRPIYVSKKILNQ